MNVAMRLIPPNTTSAATMARMIPIIPASMLNVSSTEVAAE